VGERGWGENTRNGVGVHTVEGRAVREKERECRARAGSGKGAVGKRSDTLDTAPVVVRLAGTPN
jgi:hypothetical protein